MKTILTALTGLVLAASPVSKSHAAEVKTNYYVLASKAMSQSYSNIIVSGEMDLILVQGTSNQLTMEGYQSQLENVSMEVRGNTLYINSKKKAKGTRPTVYVPVSNLAYMRVQGNSNVRTLGCLQSKDIVIELNSECNVQVKSTGKISISDYSTADYTVDTWYTEKI